MSLSIQNLLQSLHAKLVGPKFSLRLGKVGLVQIRLGDSLI